LLQALQYGGRELNVLRNLRTSISERITEISDFLSPFLLRAYMLRSKRLLIAFTKSHEQSCALVSSSACIVRRSLCFSSGGVDDKMSGKSLPTWIKPEGDGELKLYNSLTREKVNYIFFVQLFFLGNKFV